MATETFYPMHDSQAGQAPPSDTPAQPPQTLPLPETVALKPGPADQATDPLHADDPLRLFPAHIRRCVRRVLAVLAHEFPGVSIRVIHFQPGDRVTLLVSINDKPIAVNFILESECMGAYQIDRRHCEPIDHFTRNWIEVIRIKLGDKRSIEDISKRARDLVTQFPIAH